MGPGQLIGFGVGLLVDVGSRSVDWVDECVRVESMSIDWVGERECVCWVRRGWIDFIRHDSVGLV